jgi:hypothetical protein
MPKWVLEDDCLAPRHQLKIEYSGTDPFKIYQDAPDILERVWGVGSKDCWERDFRWNISKDPREFYVRIYVKKDIDIRSKALFEMIIQGTQPVDSAREGKATILLSAKLTTEYNIKLSIYRGFFWIYNRFFYKRQRSQYFDFCKDCIERTRKEFMSVLNIPMSK